MKMSSTFTSLLTQSISLNPFAIQIWSLPQVQIKKCKDKKIIL